MSDNNDVKKIFSVNILRLRNGKGLTQQELGDSLGVSKTTISEWESGKKLPKAGSIEKIATLFKVPKSVLFAEGNDRFLTYEKMLRLPIINKITSENGMSVHEDVANYEATPAEWIGDGEYFYIRAEGDSMIGARILDGDLVLIRRQEEVEDGEIAAVLVNDEIFLKRVYKRNGTLILQSENPKYPPAIYGPNDNIRIIGKLKKIIINA